MRKNILTWGMLVMMMTASHSCTTHYAVSQVSRTRLRIDKTYDKPLDSQTAEFMKPYNDEVDKLMSPVLGKAAKPLEAYRPESPLGNIMPDVMVWSAKFYDEKPDFGVFNMGGIRASLAQGDITIGEVFDVSPFENHVCFITLTGEKVLELMGQIAYRGGEGVSKEVRMTITKDNKLLNATINGKEIDPNAKYRIATVDYVSHGNDRMTAFKSGTDRREIAGDESLTRSLLIEYIKELTKKGECLDGNIEGRIIVKE